MRHAPWPNHKASMVDGQHKARYANAMQWPTSVRRLLAGSLDGERNFIRDAWDLLHNVPGGKLIFSRLLGRMAPYTGSIGATVTVLRLGHCEAVMPDSRAVRNHLQSVHAIALVNLAELAGNVALAYALPDDGRFIVAGLDIRYLKKARGAITAIGETPLISSSAKCEYELPVTLRNEAGEIVATATLHTMVGPKKSVPSVAVN